MIRMQFCIMTKSRSAMGVLRTADEDGSGTLSRPELVRSLLDMGVKATERDARPAPFEPRPV